MLFFVIKARLLGYLLLFFLDLGTFYLQHVKSALWSFAVLLLLLCGVGVTILTALDKSSQEKIAAVVLEKGVPHQEVLLNKSQLEDKLAQYKMILQIQPQHRDVLVNTSLLHKAVRNQKDAFIFWESARKLDPNNKLFSTSF